MSGDVIDFHERMSARARANGAVDRQIGTDFEDYVDTCTLVLEPGQRRVTLDNAINGEGFAMTADEAEELAAPLLERAREVRASSR